MTRILENYFSGKRIIGFVLILGVFLFTIIAGGYNGKFITGDGQGYYAYLPALFIYHDPQFSFSMDMQEKYYGKEHVADFRKKIGDRYVDKYFSGVSLLWIPFFLLAHAGSLIQGNADGYSILYQWAIALAAIFYLGLGLFFLLKLLATYGVSGKFAGVVAVMLVLGTNLSYFMVFDASYTHVYSFAMITGFLFYLRKVLHSGEKKDLYLAFLLWGILTAIRPVNALTILAVPFLSERFHTMKKALGILSFKRFFIVILILLPVVIYQMGWWKIQSGHWIVWSYVGESFDFAKPHILPFLFSYKKGLFVYTPLLLLSFPGFWYLGKRSLLAAVSLILFLLLVVYVLSSWNPWWYGMSYGSRPMIDYYAFFMIPFGIGLQSVSRPWRYGLFLAGFLFVGLNLVMEYQYRHFILHWENMNKEDYWKVFLKVAKKWRGYLWK